MENQNMGNPAVETDSLADKAKQINEVIQSGAGAPAGGIQPEEAQTDETTAVNAAGQSADEPSKKKKNKGKMPKTLIRVLISLLVIVLGIFLILFLVARAAMYDTIGSMLAHMWTELQVMWQRIIA